MAALLSVHRAGDGLTTTTMASHDHDPNARDPVTWALGIGNVPGTDAVQSSLMRLRSPIMTDDRDRERVLMRSAPPSKRNISETANHAISLRARGAIERAAVDMTS